MVIDGDSETKTAWYTNGLVPPGARASRPVSDAAAGADLARRILRLPGGRLSRA
jgi:hypothetical protein